MKDELCHVNYSRLPYHADVFVCIASVLVLGPCQYIVTLRAESSSISLDQTNLGRSKKNLLAG